MLFDKSNLKFRGEHASGRWVRDGDDDILLVDFLNHEWPIFSMEFPEAGIGFSEGAELDIENTGEREAALFGYAGEENPYCFSSGILFLKPGERQTLRITIFRDKPAAVGEAYPHMMGVPGRSVHIDLPGAPATAEPKPAVLSKLRIELEGGERPVQIAIRGAKKFGIVNPLTGDAARNSYPMTDRFGQYRHAEWPGKIREINDLIKENEREKEAIIKNPSAPGRNKYGGWSAGPRFDITGHFYAKKINGKWWLIDPEGCLYFAFGPSYAQPSCLAKTEGNEYFFEEIAAHGDFYAANLK